MGIGRLQGTPWHVEQVHKKEGEDRRHKSRCVFYNPVTGQCKDNWKCKGSRYCRDYIPLSDDEFRQRQEDTNEIKSLLAKGYSDQEISGLLDKNRRQKENQEIANGAKNQKSKGTPAPGNEANTKSKSDETKLPFLQGKQIIHKAYGQGTVYVQRGDYIWVNYNGIEKKQSLKSLIKAGLIDYGHLS